MKQRRFTDQQLFSVRNHIPIRKVIESLLDIPANTVQDIFRFRCPLCAGYNTAVKTSTNLSRCFSCGKNYNPIDMVMMVKNTDFTETVNLLLSYKISLLTDKKQLLGEDNIPAVIKQPLIERKPCKKLVPIKDIIPQLISTNMNNPEKPNNEKTANQPLPSANDIAKLERIVESLSQQIKQLKSEHQLLNPA